MARASTAIGLAGGVLAGAGVVVAAAVALAVLDRGRQPPADEPPPVAIAPEEAPAEAETAAEVAADLRADPATEVLRFDLVRVDPESGLVTVAGLAEPGARVGVHIDGTEAEAVTADAAGSFAVLFSLEPSATPRAISLVMARPDGSALHSADTLLISATQPQPLSGVAEVAPREARAAEAEADGASAERDPAAPDLAAAAPPPEVAALAPAVAADGAQRAETRPGASGAEELAAGTPLPDGGPGDDGPAALPDLAPAVEATAAPGTAGSDPLPGTTPPPSVAASGPEAVTEALREAEGPSPEEASRVSQAVAAPTVVLAGEAGLRVLQAPENLGPGDLAENVVVDAISYSAAGAVELAGRATAGAAVRLYLDNRVLETAAVGEDGAWQSALPDVDTGVYTLRVDELDADGAVISRFETPFRREDPALLAAAAADPATEAPAAAPRARVVTVQPGYTLWGISERTYGSGFLFVQVFEANRDQIRNPDLIYPGQVFALPEIGDAAP